MSEPASECARREGGRGGRDRGRKERERRRGSEREGGGEREGGSERDRGMRERKIKNGFETAKMLGRVEGKGEWKGGRSDEEGIPSDLSWSLSSSAWLQYPSTYEGRTNERANGKISLNTVTTPIASLYMIYGQQEFGTCWCVAD